MAVILLLGFASGLPLALTGGTLAVWLTDSGITMASISLFSAVATPYNFKFLWSPFIDGFHFPLLSKWLGRRRGWLVATQCATGLGLLALGFNNPTEHLGLTALLACVVAFCSASQDIVIDAYRIDRLKPEQYGAGSALAVLGYRLGWVAVGQFAALHLAATIGWQNTYFVMAGCTLVGIITALCAKEPDISMQVEQAEKSRRSVGEWLREYVATPFIDFMKHERWLAILLFILLYKLSDAFMGLMPNVFYIKLGFTKEQIANIAKGYGLAATLIGGFIGGSLVYRLGIVRSLWLGGIAHAITNLMFVVLAHIGADINMLAVSITLENITGGIGTAAFVAFISALCNARFTATQYALLSSFSAFGRTWFALPGGWFAEQLGWSGFFIFAAALAIPGLVTLAWLAPRLTIQNRTTF